MTTAVPALDKQLVALNRTILTCTVAPDLQNDDNIKRSFGKDVKAIIDENETHMADLAQYLTSAETVQKSL